MTLISHNHHGHHGQYEFYVYHWIPHLVTFNKSAIPKSLWLAAATAKMQCFLISCVRLEAINARDTSEGEMTMLTFAACNIKCYVFHLWPD